MHRVAHELVGRGSILGVPARVMDHLWAMPGPILGIMCGPCVGRVSRVLGTCWEGRGGSTHRRPTWVVLEHRVAHELIGRGSLLGIPAGFKALAGPWSDHAWRMFEVCRGGSTHRRPTWTVLEHRVARELVGRRSLFGVSAGFVFWGNLSNIHFPSNMRSFFVGGVEGGSPKAIFEISVGCPKKEVPLVLHKRVLQFGHEPPRHGEHTGVMYVYTYML